MFSIYLSLGGAGRSDAIWALQDDVTAYDAVLWTTPGTIRDNEQTTIDVSIRYGSDYGRNVTPGDPVQNLQTLYGRTIELFVISENLQHFSRLRPEYFSSIPIHSKETATFQVKHRFPSGGAYRLVVTFAHRGKTYQKLFDLSVEGDHLPPSDKLDLILQKDVEALSGLGGAEGKSASPVYNITLRLDPADPQPGQDVELIYQVHDSRDKPVTDLQVFEGTEMRVAFVRDDLNFFGVEEPQVIEESTSIPIVPRIATKILYGRGVLREILPDGRMIIDHGPIRDLVSIPGTLRFYVSDPEGIQKVVPGDWVEFWVRNEPGASLLITRIEPLGTPDVQRHVDSIRPSPNHPIFPGPLVPVRHVFQASGTYMVYAELMHKNFVIPTTFAIQVGKNDVSDIYVLDTSEDQSFSRERLTTKELNGMRIYNSAMSRSNQDINIHIGDGQLFPPNTVTCASCHGSDGRGRREGGAVAVDIRDATLTKPYVRTTESGRTRSPYSDDLLKRAIVEGLDSDGHVLDFTMPRWKMSEGDLDDLILYMHRLGALDAPGVTNDSIRIGAILDLSGPLAKTGIAVRHVFEEVFGNINTGTQVYGRNIELVVADGKNNHQQSLKAAKHLVEEEQVLALLGNLGDAATRQVIPYLEAEDVPLIAPLAPALQLEDLGTNQVFSIYPSLGYQARILIDEAVKDKDLSIALLYSSNSFGLGGLRAAKDQLALHGHMPALVIPHDFGQLDIEEVAKKLQGHEASVVLFLTGDPMIVDLIAATDRLAYFPTYMGHNLLVSGGMLQIPRAEERLMFSQNIQFGGSEHPLAAELIGILKASPATARERVIQIPAFAAAKVLVDGLRNAGRDLTRESLVRGMERVRLDTGVLGTLRFSQQNHAGVSGVVLVRPDSLQKTFVPISDKREPLTSPR